ncbi:MAG: MFS transporter [Chloroflexi bacterium]|nr:MAG: MFS transporter [Chloroflexota bacterium]
MMTDRDRPAAALWLRRPFLLFWSGSTLSLFGSRFSMLAIPLIAVLTLHASPGQMGALSALELSPYLVFGLVAGALVDRADRRLVLVLSHAGRAVVLASIPVAAATGVLSIAYLYAAGILIGFMTLFFDIAHQSYLPALVDPRQLMTANSSIQFSRSAADMTGAGLAGLLVQVLPAALTVTVNSATFLVAALTAGAIGVREQRTSAPRPAMAREVGEGLAVVGRDPVLRPLATSMTILYLLVASASTLTVLYATRELGVDPALIGAAFAIGSVGTLAGALGAGAVTARFGIGRGLLGAALVGGLSPLPLALATRSTGFVALLAAQVLLALGGTVYGIGQNSLRQAITPAELRGRMNGVMRFMGVGGQAVGSLAAGLLGQTIGLRPTMALAASGAVAAFLVLFLSPVRSLVRIQGPGSPRQEA